LSSLYYSDFFTINSQAWKPSSLFGRAPPFPTPPFFPRCIGVLSGNGYEFRVSFPIFPLCGRIVKDKTFTRWPPLFFFTPIVSWTSFSLFPVSLALRPLVFRHFPSVFWRERVCPFQAYLPPFPLLCESGIDLGRAPCPKRLCRSCFFYLFFSKRLTMQPRNFPITILTTSLPSLASFFYPQRL